MSGTIHARKVLTESGWLSDAVVHVDERGCIEAVAQDGFDTARAVGLLLPGMANLHTHSFQRAMAGLAEQRAPGGSDDFWSWRSAMYRFLELLTPEDIEAIAAQVQLEMAEAGFTACAEFHYVHHQPGGARYDDLAETSRAILSAAKTTGLGLTHLPVLYMRGGLDDRPLEGSQLRFGTGIDEFAELHARIAQAGRDMPDDFRLGVAPHSLRAVDASGLAACRDIAAGGPIHIHAAEQLREVEEVEASLGARPVRWLLDNCAVGNGWCLVHATHIDAGEIVDLAGSGAVAGLCPTTEANLGDGVFPAAEFLSRGGAFGIGSDSNIRLSLTEELRMLELSQRLSLRRRVVLADETCRSNGRYLYERAARGGATAIARPGGSITPGRLADLVALHDDFPPLDWPDPEQALDAWIFAAERRCVSDVWSAGRHIVCDGRHIARESVVPRYRATLERLRAAL